MDDSRAQINHQFVYCRPAKRTVNRSLNCWLPDINHLWPPRGAPLPLELTIEDSSDGRRPVRSPVALIVLFHLSHHAPRLRRPAVSRSLPLPPPGRSPAEEHPLDKFPHIPSTVRCSPAARCPTDRIWVSMTRCRAICTDFNKPSCPVRRRRCLRRRPVSVPRPPLEPVDP